MSERIKFDYKRLVFQIVSKASNIRGDLTWRHVKKEGGRLRISMKLKG
jgi:hypothetical protein